MSMLKHARIGIVCCCAAFLSIPVYADNIVINGGFEDPAVTNSLDWDIYSSIPGWELSRGPNIEIQRGVRGWSASEGAQWIELDADIDGPGGSMNGEAASSAVYQDLMTDVGMVYELRFAYSPRPGVADNALEILWDGVLVDTLMVSGAGMSDTNWEYFEYELAASDETTRLSFGDVSVSDSFGTLVDDVSVVAVPEPASLVMLGGGFLVLLRRRLVA